MIKSFFRDHNRKLFLIELYLLGFINLNCTVYKKYQDNDNLYGIHSNVYQEFESEQEICILEYFLSGYQNNWK